MLTEEQYKILSDLRNGNSVDEDENFELLISLKNHGYIKDTNIKQYDFLRLKICDFKITENGKSACAEYEKYLRQEEREIKNLQIAEDANKKSAKANRISICAMIISFIATILAALIPILIKFYS